MIGLQNCKVVSLVVPQVAENAAITATSVDTKGFDTGLVVIQIGDTDTALSSLKLTESDDNSTFTDVSGADFNGSTTIDGSTASLPDVNADSTIQLIQLDLRKRKRYLTISGAAGSGTNGTAISAVIVLGNAEQAPTTSSECGAAAVLRV